MTVYEESISMINDMLHDALWDSPPNKKKIYILEYIRDNLKDKDGEILNDKKW